MTPIGQAGVTEIIQSVRELSNQENPQTVTPIFSDEAIKKAIQRASDSLYYFIADKGSGFFTDRYVVGKDTDNPISIPESNSSIDYVSFVLPDNFYQILFLLYRDNPSFSDWFMSKELDLSARSDSSNNARRGHYILGKSTGDELVIVPDKCFETIRNSQYVLEYIPESVPVENLRVPKGWSNYLVYAGALEISAADFNAISEWKEKAQRLKEDIMLWAESRSPFSKGYVQRVQQDDLTIEDVDSYSIYSYASSIALSFGGRLRG